MARWPVVLLSLALASACASHAPRVRVGTTEVYTRRVDGFEQTLRLDYLSRLRVRYAFESQDSEGRRVADRVGLARGSQAGGDLENDSDEKDGGYDVDEYFQAPSPPCYLVIRVEMDTRTRAKVKQTGCLPATQRLDLDAPPFRRDTSTR